MSKERTHSDVATKAIEENRLNHERWEEALTEGVVLGLRCKDCEYVTATPKAACVRCGSHDLAVVALPETGTVYSKTTIEVAPDEQGSGYQIALVDLGDARLLGRIADDERVEIGDQIELEDTRTSAGDVAAVFSPTDS
jgi:uncharacterized OB-fold protein